MSNPAERKVTLPTARLLGAAWLACVLTGAVWAIAAIAIGQGGGAAIAGVMSAGVVGAAATIVVVALRPWRPRSLATWPSIWVAGSFVRLLITLGGTYLLILLYSATPHGVRTFGFSMLAAYIAVIVGETRIYAASMKQFTPGAEDGSATE